MTTRRNTSNNQQIKTVIELYTKGKSHREISELLSMKRPTVYSIINRYLKNGQLESAKRGTKGTKN